jgi:hypothetical protein
MANYRLPVLALAIFCSWAQPTFAQQDPCIGEVAAITGQRTSIQGGNVYAILNSGRSRGCILGPTDTSGLSIHYRVLYDSTATANARAVARTELFNTAIGQFEGLPTASCIDQLNSACMIGRHVARIKELRSALMSSPVDRNLDVIDPGNWFVIESTGVVKISDLHLNNYLTQECATSVSDAQCNNAIAISAKIMRTSLSMDQVIIAHNQPMIEANAEFLSQRDKEWDAYFNTVSVQFPWELAVNGRRFRSNNAGELDKFPRAPNSKFIILHPSAGFEHIKGASGDTGTNAAVFLELLGYEWWQWREGNSRNRWGGSVVASYANIPSMDSIGWGIFLHTPVRNISIGAVRRDGSAGAETGLILNINLATLLEQYNNGDLNTFLGL